MSLKTSLINKLLRKHMQEESVIRSFDCDGYKVIAQVNKQQLQRVIVDLLQKRLKNEIGNLS